MGSRSHPLNRSAATAGILNRARSLLTAALLALACVAVLAPAAVRADAAPACRDDTLYLRGDFGQARFSIDIAATPKDRNRGLMFVKQMPASYGMLFVYDRPQRVAFWMKNTLIPLDMIFADAQGVVQNVHANAVPGDLTSIPGKGQIQYVLEINGGMARMLGIGPGTELRHPAITDAAWPCD
ncbi:DUF192 domain-containing protein [Sagittula sp.]|uniref:DUF192 domain-containing protein n=1 Tax=Sagittula sp. TaxID=2038081 RepID=UPI0035119B7E